MLGPVKFVDVEGFLRALGGWSQDFDSRLRQAQVTVASEIATRARRRAKYRIQNLAGGTYTPGSAVSYSITFTDGKPVTVSFGGPPHSLGAEFGAGRYRQFAPFTGHTGYFFYPAIRSTKAFAYRQYWEALLASFGPAFPGEGYSQVALPGFDDFEF